MRGDNTRLWGGCTPALVLHLLIDNPVPVLM